MFKGILRYKSKQSVETSVLNFTAPPSPAVCLCKRLHSLANSTVSHVRVP